jgi:nitrogen fixation/metabolism regulation signal transduction histidine kinase
MLRLTYVIHDPADDTVSGLLLMYLSCADLTESYHSVARSMMIIMSIFSVVLIILSFIISHGFTKPFSDKTAEVIDSEVNRIVEEAYARAKEIINSHRAQLDELAGQLYEKEVLFRDDLERIYGPRVADLEAKKALEEKAAETAQVESGEEVKEIPETNNNTEA